MKKIILIILCLLNLYPESTHADTNSIIYTNGSDGNKCYRKNIDVAGNGSAINAETCFDPLVSLDGESLFYRGPSNDIRMKSLSDTANGTNLGIRGTFTLSPDGIYVLYTNFLDSNKLYRYRISDGNNVIFNATANLCLSGKDYSPDNLLIVCPSGNDIITISAIDGTNQTIIMTGGSTPQYTRFSPDGTKITYQYGAGQGLYIKNSSDSLTGSLLTSNDAGQGIAFNKDGSGAVYSGFDGVSTYKIFLKNQNDSSAGTIIVSVSSSNPTWEEFRFNTESCSDGIQNQDETGIDVGGVCGSHNFPYTGPPGTPAGTSCTSESLTDDTIVTWYSSTFGNLTPQEWSGSGGFIPIGATVGTNPEGRLGWQDTGSGGIDTDYFRGIYFAPGSYLPHETMTWGNTDPIANVEYFDDRVTPLSPRDPRVRFANKRNGVFRSFNIIEVASVGQETGATSADFGTVSSAGFQLFNKPFRNCVATGANLCTITLNGEVAQFADLHIASGFSSLRFGLSSTTTSKVSCRNDSYSCSWKYIGSGDYECSGISFDTSNNLTYGNCEVNTDGYCAPTRTFRTPTVYEHYVYDNSGSIVGINPGAYPGAPSETYRSITDDIFACPEYTDWTDFPACVLTVIKNSYSIVREGIYSATTSSEQTIMGTVKQIGSSSGSEIDFGAVSGSGENIADTMFRGVWNKAFDTDDQMMSYAIFALYGAFLMVFIVIVLMIITTNKS